RDATRSLHAATVLLRYAGFFFQAEDGIRGLIVTGVQTCALPISTSFRHPERSSTEAAIRAVNAGCRNDVGVHSGPNSIRLEWDASQVSDVQSSRDSLSGGPALVKWSDRYSPAKRRRSTAWTIPCHLGQVSPSCPSTMMAMSIGSPSAPRQCDQCPVGPHGIEIHRAIR